MNIEVKNIVISNSLSEETLAYSANVYIDGKLSGYAKNSGRGGMTHIQPVDTKAMDRINAAEKWVAAQSEIVLKPKSSDVAPLVYKRDLSDYVDDIVFAYDEKKSTVSHNKKADAAMKNGIIYGIPGVQFSGNKYDRSIDEILKRPDGQQYLLDSIKKNILPNLLKNDLILNTNLPQELMKRVGVQYFHVPGAQQSIKPGRKQAPAPKGKGPKR